MGMTETVTVTETETETETETKTETVTVTVVDPYDPTKNDDNFGPVEPNHGNQDGDEPEESEAAEESEDSEEIESDVGIFPVLLPEDALELDDEVLDQLMKLDAQKDDDVLMHSIFQNN